MEDTSSDEHEDELDTNTEGKHINIKVEIPEGIAMVPGDDVDRPTLRGEMNGFMLSLDTRLPSGVDLDANSAPIQASLKANVTSMSWAIEGEHFLVLQPQEFLRVTSFSDIDMSPARFESSGESTAMKLEVDFKGSLSLVSDGSLHVKLSQAPIELLFTEERVRRAIMVCMTLVKACQGSEPSGSLPNARGISSDEGDTEMEPEIEPAPVSISKKLVAVRLDLDIAAPVVRWTFVSTGSTSDDSPARMLTAKFGRIQLCTVGSNQNDVSRSAFSAASLAPAEECSIQFFACHCYIDDVGVFLGFSGDKAAAELFEVLNSTGTFLQSDCLEEGTVPLGWQITVGVVCGKSPFILMCVSSGDN
jgi:hypothetical protein